MEEKMTSQADETGGILSGKVAIVTGASQGIGRGIAVALAEAGASVVAAARNVTNLEATTELITAAGGHALAVGCDVCDPAEIASVVERTVEAFGGIDIVINNAQTIKYVYIMDSTDQDMEDAWRSGPFAAYHFMKLTYRYLKATGGVVVNVGSSATLLPVTARYAIYNGVKRALEELARSAHHEWAEDGISAFTIHPSAESAMTINWKTRDPEKYAAAVAGMPGGRLGDPLDDIGRPLVELVADASLYSGKTIHMDASGVGETIEVVTHVPIFAARG
jgi:NAD(P)-dependent dehydrogenase (short-subunit alcohol dehydrogenase family)